MGIFLGHGCADWGRRLLPPFLGGMSRRRRFQIGFQIESITRPAYYWLMNAALRNEALTLPDTDKAKLIDALWDSLSSSELKKREAAWAGESERRIDAYNAGLLKARNAEDVLGDLKKRFRK